jgi:hypothetical protein
MKVWREEGFMKPGIKVLFLAAEAEPFVEVGGLGDVSGSLPAATRALLHANDWHTAAAIYKLWLQKS